MNYKTSKLMDYIDKDEWYTLYHKGVHWLVKIYDIVDGYYVVKILEGVVSSIYHGNLFHEDHLCELEEMLENEICYDFLRIENCDKLQKFDEEKAIRMTKEREENR